MSSISPFTVLINSTVRLDSNDRADNWQPVVKTNTLYSPGEMSVRTQLLCAEKQRNNSITASPLLSLPSLKIPLFYGAENLLRILPKETPCLINYIYWLGNSRQFTGFLTWPPTPPLSIKTPPYNKPHPLKHVWNNGFNRGFTVHCIWSKQYRNLKTTWNKTRISCANINTYLINNCLCKCDKFAWICSHNKQCEIHLTICWNKHIM